MSEPDESRPGERLSAAPWIPPVEDPEIEAARAAAAERRASTNVVEAPKARYLLQLSALLIDLVPYGALWLRDGSWLGWQMLILVLVCTRLLPLCFFGRTLGSSLVGFRVVGPDGGRLSPPRAALRELLLPLSLLWIATVADGLLSWNQWRPDVLRASAGKELDPRLLPDLLADTWALIEAPALRSGLPRS